VREPDPDAIRESVQAMADAIRAYVPGYRLKLCDVDGDLVTVLLEIEGAGDYLPAYAGNLDVMTAAAARVGEELAKRMLAERCGSDRAMRGEIRTAPAETPR
jgi:acetaldehyde dehydrogenase